MLEELGEEVVRLNDGFEKYGLVDYQMGFWEEEIIRRKYQAESKMLKLTGD